MVIHLFSRLGWPALRRSLFVGLLLLTLGVGLIATPPTQAQGALPGSFAPGPCPIPVPAELTVDCGYLTVAESRQNSANQRTIRLAVAIVRSPNPNKAADAAIFLSGGPGQPALPLLPFVVSGYAPVLAERDLVLIDQRGTGYSQPALNCGLGDGMQMAPTGGIFTIGVQSNERPLLVQIQRDMLIACGAQLRAQGIDLSAYTSVENAADLEDLRRALGVPQWNLIGGSYGTRLALSAMQYRPETIRSAVLDSVYPLEANFQVDVFRSYNQSLSNLFAACAADATCNAAYPNLGASFDRMIVELNANAAQVPLINLENGELITYLPVTGIDVSTIIFQLFYITDAIPLLPALIHTTTNGDYSLLAILLSALVLEGEASAVPPISLGMQTAVQCNEDVTFAQARDFVAARDSNRRASALAFVITFNEAYLEVCEAWGLRATNAAENQPVRSAVPTLQIGGAFDPITPPSYAQQQGRNLSQVSTLIVPRGGHTPSIGSACLAGALTRFIQNPALPVDGSCLAAEGPQPFLVR